jgi:hypothetical protein
MKFCLSSVVVNPDKDWKGLPASFLITGAQQLGGFCIFWFFLLLGRLIGCTDYWPKILNGKEIKIVCLFSLSFIMNIALNNFSLSLITITLNLIIRSCQPLSTWFAQNMAGKITRKSGSSLNLVEMALMVAGVACAAVAVVAKMEGSSATSASSKSRLFGVLVCVVSLLAGSVNLVLAGVLGTSVKLNSLDTTVYNAIPACIILAPLVPTYVHPNNWPDHGPDTDWNILMEVWALRPFVVYLALFSGLLALAYNTLQFGIVQELSPAHVAFAGNFNTACMIPLSFLLGFESLPPGRVPHLFNLPAGPLMICASIGSIVAFACYNMISKVGGRHGHGPPPAEERSSMVMKDESENENGMYEKGMDEESKSEDDESEDDSQTTGCFGR